MKKSIKFVSLSLLLIVLITACNPSTAKEPEGPELSAVYGKLDASHPYDAYHYGLFDNQTTTFSTTYRDGNAKYPIATTTARYSAFIPKGFQVKSSAYIILIPDGTKARDFARSEIGMEWIELAQADEDPFAVVFVEPQDGGTWNTAEAADGRDEIATAYAVFTAVRDKSSKDNAFISVDKSGVRLVGYEEGATAAALWAASWPHLFANTTLINPTAYPEATLNKWLDSTIFPFAIDNSNGYDIGMKARDVAMPMFLYADEDKTIINSYSELYKGINAACDNPDSSRDKSLEVVKTLSTGSAEDIYDNAKQNNRFLGYPGGTIRGVYGAYTGKGFHPVWEEKIGDYVRRWLVYTPSSYDGKTAVPLVVALHGSSASVTDLPEESLWTEIADDEGFIVVFVQGYPNGTPNPIPSWFSLQGGAKTDIDYLKEVVAKVRDQYNIDSSKMYLTGHSMGSMMTQVFAASTEADFFAAYGPVGYALDGNTLKALASDSVDGATNEKVIPLWFFKGQFDLNGYDISDKTKGDGAAFAYWAETVNALSDKSAATAETGSYNFGALPSGKYTTTTYSEESVPIVKYTQVLASPHTYMPEESELLWSWFEKWSRGENGEALFDGEEVTLTR